MNYEKKYKEALERARELAESNPSDEGIQKYVQDAFPELRESEDEKIRKEIIDIIDSFEVAHLRSAGLPTRIPEYLAWLEKQGGEQNLTLPKWKYKKDNTPLLRDSLILNKYGCVAKSPSGALVSDVWVIDYAELAKLPKEEIEKQDEQKPVELSEYDKGRFLILDSILDTRIAEYADDDSISMKNEMIDTKEWLNSIKSRVVPQEKPEWSKGDEDYLNTTIAYLMDAKEFKETAKNCINWLKSLSQHCGR